MIEKNVVGTKTSEKEVTEQTLERKQIKKVINKNVAGAKTSKKGVIKIKGFEYVVIDTGYTDRIGERFVLLEDEEEDEGEIGDKYGDGSILYNKTTFSKSEVEFYKYGDEKEIEYVEKILDGEYCSGIVVFKCSCLSEAFNKIAILGNMNYCYGVDATNIYEIKMIDDVLIIKIDCESG